MRTTIYLHVKDKRKYIPIMPPDLGQGLRLISSNYPCLKLIFMVPKVFEPLKFYCIYNKYALKMNGYTFKGSNSK